MYALSSFFLIFLFTFLFAYLFLDLAKWLEIKIAQLAARFESPKVRKFLVAFNKFPILISIIYLVFLTVIITMFYRFIPHLIEEIKGFVKLVPDITNKLRSAADNLQSQVGFNL